MTEIKLNFISDEIGIILVHAVFVLNQSYMYIYIETATSKRNFNSKQNWTKELRKFNTSLFSLQVKIQFPVSYSILNVRFGKLCSTVNNL